MCSDTYHVSSESHEHQTIMIYFFRSLVYSFSVSSKKTMIAKSTSHSLRRRGEQEEEKKENKKEAIVKIALRKENEGRTRIRRGTLGIGGGGE